MEEHFSLNKTTWEIMFVKQHNLSNLPALEYKGVNPCYFLNWVNSFGEGGGEDVIQTCCSVLQRLKTQTKIW